MLRAAVAFINKINQLKALTSIPQQVRTFSCSSQPQLQRTLSSRCANNTSLQENRLFIQYVEQMHQRHYRLQILTWAGSTQFMHKATFAG